MSVGHADDLDAIRVSSVFHPWLNTLNRTLFRDSFCFSKGCPSPRAKDVSELAVARPWRRFLRFSVRGLILLALVIGAGLGWIVRSARIQREAVAAITASGGSVKYDWQENEQTLVAAGKPWAPEWLVDLVGVDYFGHVTTVLLEEQSDATFAQVGHLAGLQLLCFDASAVSDVGWEHLRGLTRLSRLIDAGPEYSDDWLVHLPAFSNLSYLDLSSHPITDRGLAHLARLPNLSILDLNNTRITDTGLVHLSRLTKLSDLSLDCTKIGGAGLRI